MYRTTLTLVVIITVLFSAPCIAWVGGGVHSAYESQGLFTFDIDLGPEDVNTFYIAKVQLAMPTTPEDSLWTAEGPWWFYDHQEPSFDWDISIERMTETGLSWYHDLPLTAITWTAREPLLMRPYPNTLQFQVQTVPWGLPTNWSVLRAWGSSGELLYWTDFSPLAEATPEPSSILSLIGGIAWGGWFALRRRAG